MGDFIPKVLTYVLDPPCGVVAWPYVPILHTYLKLPTFFSSPRITCPDIRCVLRLLSIAKVRALVVAENRAREEATVCAVYREALALEIDGVFSGDRSLAGSSFFSGLYGALSPVNGSEIALSQPPPPVFLSYS